MGGRFIAWAISRRLHVHSPGKSRGSHLDTPQIHGRSAICLAHHYGIVRPVRLAYSHGAGTERRHGAIERPYLASQYAMAGLHSLGRSACDLLRPAALHLAELVPRKAGDRKGCAYLE